MKYCISLSFIILLLFLSLCNRTLIKGIKSPSVIIEEYLRAHPNLPEKDRKCIKERQPIEIGILKETVQFLVGFPTSIDTIDQDEMKVIRWNFKRTQSTKNNIVDSFIFNFDGILIKIMEIKNNKIQLKKSYPSGRK